MSETETRIIAGHYRDEQRAHRRTRELLAVALDVAVDTEAYDEATDKFRTEHPHKWIPYGAFNSHDGDRCAFCGCDSDDAEANWICPGEAQP